MKLRDLIIGITAFQCILFSGAAAEQRERPDWAQFFEEFKAQGTIIVVDERAESNTTWIYDESRAGKRYSPASTFKIPHTLFALDAGLVRDEFDVIRWDGVTRPTETWNRNQNLRSAMRNSVVWVYQKFARALGEEQERRYLRKINYGNADPTGADPFWVEGNLQITAQEQIVFLGRLYRNELPFRVEHQRLVKDIMITEAGREWILRAKTGWSGTVGWWVGWVEWPSGPVFFALNIDTPHRLDDLRKRQDIVRSILRSIKALPPIP
jgi:beta-lactamase class D